MKKNLLKFISSTLAAVLSAGCLGTYAINVQLDFDVESGEEYSYASSEDAAVLSSSLSPALDFTVEDASDVFQTVSSDENTAELMAFEDPVFFKGSGIESDPYVISTVQELLSIAYWVNNGAFTDAYYRLENDIDLAGAEWTPIGDYKNSASYAYAFDGVFDGNGKTVSNFKITEPQIYAGFFGLINNAVIKNLTLSDFEINVEYAAPIMYVGGIVARCRAVGDGKTAAIENCHVKDAVISAASNTRIYGSGHSGYLHSSDNAVLNVDSCSTNARCNFTVVDSNSSTTADRSMIRAGGLIGYVGITDGKMNITSSSSNSAVITKFSDISATGNNDVHIGGFAGDFALSTDDQSTRSMLKVDSCYSTNMVYSMAEGNSYAGGFTGYLVSDASDVVISNCHTSSAVYSSSSENSSYIGGFSSIIGIDTSTPVGIIDIHSSYASGNTIDIYSNNSIAGRFTSYILGEPDIMNCFAMAASALKAKEEIETEAAPETLLSAEQASDIKTYTGFDVDTWVMGNAPYSYPVLAENPLTHSGYSAFLYDDSTGMPVEYQTSLSYGDTPDAPSEVPDSIYEFSHWSCYVGGPDVLDGSSGITSDVVLFPNDSNEYKSYDVSFSANGEIFETKSLKYNSAVEFPTAPPKPADNLFRYTFSHWSKTENGETAVNEAKETVKGDITYYAVYKKVETGVWDGVSTSAYTNGNGSAEAPYEISDAYQLANLAKTVNEGTAAYGAHYILTKDIDLGGFEWTPIGTPEKPFTGTVSGNGYSVYNFEITDAETLYAGLFGYVLNADISKLEVSGFRIDLTGDNITYHAGAIAAYIASKAADEVTKISECYTDGEINITAKIAYAGGITGCAEDTETSTFSIENCYSSTTINLDTTANSTAGGILGNLQSKHIGLSFVDKCYYDGDISALSDEASYGGGIVGFVHNDDNWVDEASLSAAVLLAEEGEATVRNSFYAGSAITLSLGYTSYGGAVYGYKADVTLISSCGYLASSKITASKVGSNENVFTVAKISDLYDAAYLTEKFGFDFEAVWAAKDSALPVLQIFNQIKNVFRINEYALDSETGRLDVELKICYRDVDSYLVLLGAYDERGKMIGFDSVSVTNPAELQTIDMRITGLKSAVSCTLSVINPKTLGFIEAPVTLTK